MSLESIRIALETQLATITPVLVTAWENNAYISIEGTPYQQVWLLPATPDNPTMGDDHYREQGLLQVSLKYPLLTGPALITARAELIRSAFKRGTSLTSGSITVRISSTPEIGIGQEENGWWVVPVRIRWFADVM